MTLTPSSLRLDLKCGKGAISKGEKCHKGAATQAQAEAATLSKGRVATGWVARRQTWGERFSDDLRSSFVPAVKTAASTGAIIGGAAGIASGTPIAARSALIGGLVGGAFGAVTAPLGAAYSATVGPPTSVLERRKISSTRKKKNDSIYADGFMLDVKELAL